jgi:hypothetical protein
MLLKEANALLKKTTITEDQLWGLSTLYILLDLDKADFCKIVDAVGLDTLLKKQKRYERLDKAERELTEKEKYIDAKNRLLDLEDEKSNLKKITESYETKERKRLCL